MRTVWGLHLERIMLGFKQLPKSLADTILIYKVIKIRINICPYFPRNRSHRKRSIPNLNVWILNSDVLKWGSRGVVIGSITFREEMHTLHPRLEHHLYCLLIGAQKQGKLISKEKHSSATSCEPLEDAIQGMWWFKTAVCCLLDKRMKKENLIQMLVYVAKTCDFTSQPSNGSDFWSQTTNPGSVCKHLWFYSINPGRDFWMRNTGLISLGSNQGSANDLFGHLQSLC